MNPNLQKKIENRLLNRARFDIQKENEMVKGRIMSPKDAIEQNLNPKMSAVLLLLYQEEDVWKTIFTLRHSYKGVHSNQVSLPGGKKEDQDQDLSFTALRETEEEVGIYSSNIQLLGELSELYIPPSNFIVQPYVGFMKENMKFKAEEKEVKEIISTPISRLFDRDVLKEKDIYMERYDRDIEVKYFDIKGHVVWGATAIILEEFRSLMKDVF